MDPNRIVSAPGKRRDAIAEFKQVLELGHRPGCEFVGTFSGGIKGASRKDTEIIEPVLQRVGIHGKGWWRYRIPGQGVIDWPRFIDVLMQARFAGGVTVEHEDPFWDEPPSNGAAEFPQARKDGFILASRFLRMYLPGRLG